MDDRFPERMDDEDVGLLLKELRLSGENPEWREEFGQRVLVLHSNGMGNARLYKLEGGVWVKKPRESLGFMIAEHIRAELKKPSMFGEMMEALKVEPVVEVTDLVEDEK